jgi:Domain of unknown function (DUF3854)
MLKAAPSEYLDFGDFRAAIEKRRKERAIDPVFTPYFTDSNEIDPGGTPRDEIADLLNWGRKQAGFSRRKALYGAFLMNEDGSPWQAILSRSLDYKGFGEATGKLPKTAPKGNGSRAFLPDIPIEIRRKIGERYGVSVPETGSFWDWLYYHPTVPIILTEGGDKALSLLSKGYVAISFYGCTAGYGIKDSTGLPCAPKLIPDLLKFCIIDGRKVIIAFDEDDQLKTRAKVAKATKTLAGLLQAQGCKVFVAVWEGVEGKGIDDAIYKAGSKAEDWLAATIDGAPKFEQWEKDERKARLMRLILWLNSNEVVPERLTKDRYIPTLPELEPGAIHGVQSTGTGDGKTTRIGMDYVNAIKTAGGFTLVLYHANSVGQQAAGAWDLPHRHDYEDGQNDLFLIDARNRGGCVMCFDSLHRLPSELLAMVNVVILDECNQGIDHLCSGGTLKERQSQIMTITADVLRNVIQRGGSIVLSEVTIYTRTLEYVKALSKCSKVRMFSHERSSFEAWDISIQTGSTSGFFSQLLQSLKDGKRLIVAVASQEQGEKLERLIAQQLPDKQVIRIDSKTNDKGRFGAFLTDPNAYLEALPSLPDVLLYSPSCRSGVSISVPGFDEVWAHCTTHHPDMWMQMIGRYRLPVPRKIFVVPFVLATGDENTKSIYHTRKRLQANQNGFAKMYGIDIAGAVLEAAEAGEDVVRIANIENATIEFIAAERTAIGCQKAIAKDYFIHLLESHGHSITIESCPKDAATDERLKKIEDDLWREAGEIMASLQDGDEKKNIPTWHKELLAKKLKLREDFPGVTFDDADYCYTAIFKDGGMYRGAQLQAATANFSKAKQLEAKQVEAIISGKIKLPHKLPKLAMKAGLMNALGIASLVDGCDYNEDDPRVHGIKTKALFYCNEIAYWLGLHIKESQTSIEIANKLLKKFGLEAEVTGWVGGRGCQVRQYGLPGLLNATRIDLYEAACRRFEVPPPPPPPEPAPGFGTHDFIDVDDALLKIISTESPQGFKPSPDTSLELVGAGGGK